MAVFCSHSEEETLRWAQDFATTLHAGDTVLLEGEMGAGKTVLAKGIAKGLGVREQVTSPTYAFVNEYRGSEVFLFHFDCYRLPSEDYAERLGFSEYFERGGVCLIEWGDRIPHLLPEEGKKIVIQGNGEGVREIHVELFGD